MSLFKQGYKIPASSIPFDLRSVGPDSLPGISPFSNSLSPVNNWFSSNNNQIRSEIRKPVAFRLNSMTILETSTHDHVYFRYNIVI